MKEYNRLSMNDGCILIDGVKLLRVREFDLKFPGTDTDGTHAVGELQVILPVIIGQTDLRSDPESLCKRALSGAKIRFVPEDPSAET